VCTRAAHPPSEAGRGPCSPIHDAPHLCGPRSLQDACILSSVLGVPMSVRVTTASFACFFFLSCNQATPPARAPRSGPADTAQETVATPVAPVAPNNTSEEPVDAPTPDCTSLDADSCAARNDCSPVRGLASEAAAALERGEQPAAGVTAEFFGCRSAEQACKEVETYRTPGPGKECFLFGNSCVPDGWQPCRPPASKPSP
jgi:hypothetical protein